jgi:hypothetical protein
MRLDLRDLGGAVKVDLPLTDVVQGELGILRVTDEGKESEEQESDSAPEGTGEGDSATTTTTG